MSEMLDFRLTLGPDDKWHGEPTTPPPQRVQLRRVKGWKMPENTVKVDRSTRWGNVYHVEIFKDFTAADAVARFRDRLTANLYEDARWITTHLPDLRGKNLACWCKPGAPCHADVLLELANADHHQGGA